MPVTDRRRLRTRQLLRRAMLELIREKGLEGLSVSDLTERAGVNRGTFYLHYRDVYDLLEQTKREMLDGLKEKVTRISLSELTKSVARDEPYPVLERILEYFNENGEFFEVMLGPKGDLSYPMQIRQMMKQHLFAQLVSLQPIEEKMLVPQEFLIAYVSSAHIGILMHWFETGRRQSPRELAGMITRILHYGPLRSTGVQL
jgi:AcrR family transcriptional regulator